MKKIYLLLLVIFCFFGFNKSVYAVLTDGDVHDVTCEELESSGKLDDKNLLFDASGYSTNCIYTYTRTHSSGDTDATCYIMQLAFNLDGTYKNGTVGLGTDYVSYQVKDGWWVFDSYISEEYLRDRVGACPVKVGYEWSIESAPGSETSSSRSIFSFEGKGDFIMNNFFFEEYKIDIPSLIIDDPNAGGDTCVDILGDDGVNLLKTIKNLIMIFVPILLVVLAVIDIASAMFSSDENNMKKAQGKLVKRVIVAIVIFLIPFLLGFILDIVNMIWPNIDANLCGIF